MKKRLFKFTLCAVLLAAGTSMYADGVSDTGENTGTETDNGPVTLNDADQTKISWKAFVNAINNPVKVTDAPLDPNSDVVKNYTTANRNLEAAKTAFGTANTQLADAKDDLNGNADKNIKGALKEEEEAEATQRTANSAYNTANYEYQNAVSQNPTAISTLTQLESSLQSKIARFDAIPGLLQNLTKTEIVNAPWILTLQSTLKTFAGYYNAFVDYEGDDGNYNAKGSIYYLCYSITGKQKKYYLYLSVENPGDFMPAGVTGQSWNSGSEINLYRAIDALSMPAGKYFNTVSLYDSEFDEDNDHLVPVALSSDISNVMDNAVTTVNQLVINKTYTEEKTTITDQAKYTALQNEQQTLKQDIGERAEGEQVATGLYKRVADQELIVNGYSNTIDHYTANTTEINPVTGEVYKDANGNIMSVLQLLSYKSTQADAAVAAATKKVQNCQAAVTAAETAVTNATNTVATMQTAYNAAKTAYDAAQTAANEAASAAAMVKYNEITLDPGTVIDATEQITNAYTGTITGNGSIFNVNVPNNAPLFKTFGGHVDDAAINGTFGGNLTGASFTDVARWDGNGKIYSETGAETEFKSSALSDAFGAFGYALRDNEYFGVDFKDTKIVAAAAAPSKVFSLTAYDLPAGKDDTDPVPTQTYVQLGAQGSNVMKTIVNNNELTTYEVPQNRFAQSATADVAGLGLANVYYGTNNDCDMAKIVDRENFYCPVTVKAKAIDYTREFKKGYNSVCLPFTLSTNLSEKIVSICEYESVDFTAKKFWFKQNATSIKANTPALIVLEEDVDKVKFNIEGVTIAATDKTQIEKSDAMHGDSHSYGTLKKAHVNEFEGEEFSDYIYGLNTEGKFIAAAKNATFPAFRMVIGTKNAVASRENAPRSGDGLDVMSIGIHNENGVDITDQFKDLTTGVNDIKSDVSSLSIVGGQGAIKFNSDADYGKVKIYNINGALVTVANVMTGTTSVNVEKGIYIVMGKKVMVK